MNRFPSSSGQDVNINKSFNNAALSFFFLSIKNMDHSACSNSVPLLSTEDNIGKVSVRKVDRSSVSMSSIHHVMTRPRLSIFWNESMSKLHDTNDDSIYDYDLDGNNADDYSSLSGNSEDEIDVAISGRKTIIVSQQQQQDVLVSDQSPKMLCEDIWVDSPTFHEYLQSLESWLYHYVAWLENLEQCRKLENGNILLEEIK